MVLRGKTNALTLPALPLFPSFRATPPVILGANPFVILGANRLVILSEVEESVPCQLGLSPEPDASILQHGG
jgi:hypothetical protein